MTGRGWQAYAVVGGLVALVYAVLPGARLRDVVYVAVGLSCVAAIERGVRRHRPAHPLPWHLMALGQLLWVVADGLYSWAEDVRQVVPFPGPPDVFYLSAYPLLAAGLLGLVRVRRSGPDRERDLAGLVDSALVTIGLGLLSWVCLASPLLADHSASVLARAVSAGYPAADLLLLAVLVRLVSVGGTRTAAFRLLTVAAGLLLAADTAYAVSSAGGADATVVENELWLLSYVLWGAAALHPSMRALTEPGAERPQALTSRRLAAMAAAVLLAPGTLAVQLLLGHPLAAWPVVCCSTALFLLVVARMQLAVREVLRSAGQRDQLRQDLVHQAAHDPLTALANRARVLSLVDGALSRAVRHGSLVGLLYLDLDGFKAVNDTLGHRGGDAVLKVVAERLRTLVRAGDTVGRLGGDEFVVLAEPVASPADLVELAERLIAGLGRPIPVGGQLVRVGVSIGIGVDLDARASGATLLHHADIAAGRAKADGGGRAQVFDEALRRELSARTELETAISLGLLSDQFTLHYQPVVDLRTGRTEGFEALVRWERPGHGLVPPDTFIPVAEQSDLICGLGRWVLGQACRQLVTWRQADPDWAGGTTMAVNISGRHLSAAGIVSDVEDALRGSGLDPAELVLEVTETVALDDSVATARMAELRALGVALSIDDFGTGYTSIGQLRTLPADVLKIDRSFADTSDPGTRELVGLMVQAAHTFGLRVVAEGVEDEEQRAVLTALGCDAAQGWLFARAAAPAPGPPPLLTAVPAVPAQTTTTSSTNAVGSRDGSAKFATSAIAAANSGLPAAASNAAWSSNASPATPR